MTRDKLAADILQLSTSGGMDIDVAQQLLAFTPHLEMAEVVEILQPFLAGDEPPVRHFIGPGVYVRGAMHVYGLHTVTGSPNRIRLQLVRTHRVKASFACCRPGTTYALDSTDYGQQERAINYAEMTWGDDLIWDRSRDTVAGHVATLVPGTETTPANMYYHSYFALLGALLPTDVDRYKPTVELFDDAILQVSSHPVLMMEMEQGHADHRIVYNCGNCGGGLVEGICCYCKVIVPWPDPSRVQWPYALPMKVVHDLRHNVRQADPWFKVDPLLAIKADYRRWAHVETHFTPTATREARVVDLGDE